MHDPSQTLDPQALLAEQGWMRSLALALLKDAHLADDAVQEAVLAALRRPPAGDRPLRPWLATVLRNAARKRAERERNRAATETGRARERADDVGPSSDDLAARLELQGRVVETVRELDEPYRSTLLLRFFEDLTPTEIATRQGVPAGTVRWRLKVGLDSVRERLDARHDGDRLAWASALVPFLRPDERLASGVLASTLTTLLAMPPIAQASLLLISTVTVGAVVLRTPFAPAAPAGSDAPTPTQPVAAVAAVVPQDPDAAAERVPLAPVAEDDVFGSGLLAFAEAEIRAAWRETRDEEIDDRRLEELLLDFQEMVRTYPRGRTIALANELTRAESLVAGGPLFEILAQIERDEVGPQLVLASDAEAFAAHFRLAGPERVVDGPALLADSEAEIEAGMTLVFPAGVYDVSQLMSRDRTFPAHVTLRGAGMNSTLLVADRGFETKFALTNFGLSDLTVHTPQDCLFDLKEPASILLDRVRVTGFDTGAGGSNAFDVHELALLARDCVFSGGYGRSPQHGSFGAFRSDAVVARFERCEFDLLSLEFDRLDEDAAVVVDSSRFTRLLDVYPESVESRMRDRVGIVFEGSPRDYFTRLEDGRWVTVPSRDLESLFPGWKERSSR